MVFTGTRLGLYDHVRDFVTGGDQHPSVGGQVAAAVITSSIGISLANPADVIKVRFQADSGNNNNNHTNHTNHSSNSSSTGRQEYRSSASSSPSHPRRTGGTFLAYKQVAQREGVIHGLWRGYTANLVRNSSISSAEIVTYAMTKRTALETFGWEGKAVGSRSGVWV